MKQVRWSVPFASCSGMQFIHTSTYYQWMVAIHVNACRRAGGNPSFTGTDHEIFLGLSIINS